ncbi:MAG: energy transducer TonB [Verrucomicrobiota bacterium]
MADNGLAIILGVVLLLLVFLVLPLLQSIIQQEEELVEVIDTTVIDPPPPPPELEEPEPPEPEDTPPPPPPADLASVAPTLPSLDGAAGAGTVAIDLGIDFGNVGGALVAQQLNETQPRPVSQPSPAYPPDLYRKGITGTVKISAVVTAQGRVSNAQVVDSPHPGLSKAALDAVRQWRYQAGTRGDQKVSMKVLIPVKFGA